MIFEKKKLNTETLSEYLREVRENLGLSLEQASERTGVALKFLENLEQGQYSQLPPDVYVVGFLKQISQAYAIPCEALIDQYKKERGIVERVVNPTPQTSHGIRTYVQSLTVTPKLLTLAVAGLFIVGTLSYLGWQVTSLSRPPALTITSPVDNAKILGAVVTVQGKTEPGTNLRINDQNVLVQSDGSFQTSVSLTNGQTALRIEAKNKFDHGVTKVVPLVVEQQMPTVAGADVVGNADAVNLELDFTKAATITLTVDGQVLPQEAVSAGSAKYVQAHEEIMVSASDAGAIKVRLNNNDLGFLGKDGQVMTDVPFTVDSVEQISKNRPKK